MEQELDENRYLDRNQLQSLLEALAKRRNIDGMEDVMPYINDEQLKDKIQKMIHQNRWDFILERIEEEYLANIASQIRKEDYDYLLGRGITEKPSIGTKLIAATGDIGYIQKCLETEKLDFKDRLCLVCATKDKEDIKNFLFENEERLDGDQKVKLIVATNEKEFVKQCVEYERWLLKDLQRAKLIAATGDTEYIKSFIESRKLDFRATIILIEATNEPLYIEEKIEQLCLEIPNLNIYGILTRVNIPYLNEKYANSYRLKINQRVELVARLDNPHFIENWISENIDVVTRKELIRLIIATNDPEYIENVMKDKVVRINK